MQAQTALCLAGALAIVAGCAGLATPPWSLTATPVSAGKLGAATTQSPTAYQVSWASNYVTGDTLFGIPPAWADAYASGRALATGRYRDGGQGAQGPSLFAIAPWAEGNPPAQGSTLSTTPLLLYGVESPQQKYHLGAASFDRQRGLLYVLEPLADGDRPLVHVWKISNLKAQIPTPKSQI